MKSDINNSYSIVLQGLMQDMPSINFMQGKEFKWSYDSQTIHHKPVEENSLYSLLHEAGHAQLQHDSFSSDTDLIAKELDAWAEAKICKKCGHNVLQNKDFGFKCHNCNQKWEVSAEQIH